MTRRIDRTVVVIDEVCAVVAWPDLDEIVARSRAEIGRSFAATDGGLGQMSGVAGE
ncbi:hypothetical protein KO481_33525 [Nocardia sp. NEAU-G5]|uniref:Uncharacterized protein n=1 Tax=Nocardia albiluteola TaxID=2842303 RepID=A0ABS6BAJ5_9NOCA|nr:hypothetical protein [Nocardia albiluteola]MBU3066430.1 hypothetical protein [Nocardia albiluteola]